MVDNRFFNNAGPMMLNDIATLTGTALTAADGNVRINDIAPLDQAQAEHVSFLDNVKYQDAFIASKAGACFVKAKFVKLAPKGMALLVTDEPYYAFALTAQKFYPQEAVTPGISPQAQIAKSAVIGKDCCIEMGVIIGEHAVIGERCHIGAYSVIGSGVEVGNDSRIFTHCTITHAIIGKRALIHRGVHIGQDGFGFAAGSKGMLKIPQLGRVLIGDDVEIGSGSCVDRGASSDTVIGDGCKIDNLIQIGHNVRLGKYVVMAAQVGVSGSTHIGDGAQIGGQVGITGHLHVGAGAKIGARAGIITDIPAGQTYGGFPAVPMRDWHRQSFTLAKLIKKKEDDR